MARTVSEVRGTGADITLLGIPGTSPLGGIADGTTAGISEAGIVRIITVASTEDGTTLGSGEVPGDGMTLGTVRSTTHTTADGMVDGIHTGDITTITDMARGIQWETPTTAQPYGTDQGIRRAQSASSAAGLRLEEESAQEVLSAEAAAQPAGHRHQEVLLLVRVFPAGQLLHLQVHLQAGLRS